MTVKPHDKIFGKPTTKTMNIMTEKMAKIVASVKTTVWGGKHGSLALVINEDDYITIMRDATETIDQLTKPATSERSYHGIFNAVQDINPPRITKGQESDLRTTGGGDIHWM